MVNEFNPAGLPLRMIASSYAREKKRRRTALCPVSEPSNATRARSAGERVEAIEKAAAEKQAQASLLKACVSWSLQIAPGLWCSRPLAGSLFGLARYPQRSSRAGKSAVLISE
jgi:hypothetical protein